MDTNYIIVFNDNLYYPKDSIGFAGLYNEIFVTQNNKEIHYRFYIDGDGNEQRAKHIRSLTIMEMEQLLNGIRQQLNIDTLDFCYTGGKTLLTINISEVRDISRVIQTMLKKGFRLYMNDHSQLTINIQDVNGQYNQKNRELALLEMYKRYKNQSNNHWCFVKKMISYEWRCAGRVKLPELKEWLILHFPDENREQNIWSTIEWDLPDVDDAHDANDANNNQEEDDGLCIVCFENERETYLEPCGHIISCEKCSDDLAQSDNENIRKLCIYCQQRIDTISYIKSGKTIDVFQ